MAGQVWREHYSSILTTGQIEYMLERFQSVEAVSEQIAKGGYQYYLLGNGDENFGYFALKQEGESLFLSKYYMQKCYRGRGYASAGFDFIEKFAAGRALASVWLTVNKRALHTSMAWIIQGLRTSPAKFVYIIKY